jgi:hypothetical protein
VEPLAIVVFPYSRVGVHKLMDAYRTRVSPHLWGVAVAYVVTTSCCSKKQCNQSDTQEWQPSLREVNVEGNPLARDVATRHRLVHRLPGLCSVDGGGFLQSSTS